MEIIFLLFLLIILIINYYFLIPYFLIYCYINKIFPRRQQIHLYLKYRPVRFVVDSLVPLEKKYQFLKWSMIKKILKYLVYKLTTKMSQQDNYNQKEKIEELLKRSLEKKLN